MTADESFTEADLRAAVRRSGESESYVQALLADMREHREPLVLPPGEFAAVKSVARTFGAGAVKPCGCGPDEPCGAHAEAGPPDDTARALTGAPDGARERTGAVPPVGRESLRALISSALEASIDCCARCKVCERQVDAVMAAVEEEAVNRMAEQFVAESRFRSMQIRDGRINLEAEPAREIAAMWAGAVRTLLDGAENYAEIEMEFKPAGTVERYAFRLQRVGKLTPYQARQAAEARADAAEAMLAEVRSTVTAFLAHYGNSTAASFQQALDLAHGVLQVLDRVPLGAQERGGGEGQASEGDGVSTRSAPEATMVITRKDDEQ